ncbi:MAG: hypothetical protein HZC41_24275 [Chloroflexi bacterium]|nr:hypothetical protein [Chloroflexota bacterium]
MTVSYLVGLDVDSDGAFTDISADVLALEWRLGLAAPDDSAAPPASAAITVRNVSRAYSPEASALPPGTPVRIQSHDGLTTRTHFTGFVSRVEPAPGDQGPRAAVIQALGADAALEQHRIRLPPQINQRADAIISRVLDAVPLRRSVLQGRWLIGRSGNGELGRNTRLPAAPLTRSLQPGLTVFAYVGDTWADGIPADEAIRQVVEAERGRFFFNRAGTAVFFNRHHLLKPGAPAAVFDDDMDHLDYSYGDSTVSRVQVRLTPRRLGADGSLLWALPAPQPVPPGDQPRALVARFRADDERPIGALAISAPVRGVDYSANLAPDGSGADVTRQVDVIVRAAGFSAATLEIRNRSRLPVYLYLQLRGTPLYRSDPLTVEQTSPYALAVYGLRTLAFDLPALDAVEQADRLARYELARRKTPRGTVRTLTLAGPAHEAQILARTLFDRITVRETQTGHVADYFIVAETHRVDLGGARHRVTWTLESVRAGAFWLLRGSRLRRDTVVAY